MLLKLNILQYWRSQGLQPGTFPKSFDLTGPMVDFVKIAESMGVPGARVERPEQAAPAIREMLNHDGPFLIDMVVSSELPDATSGK
jgi:benzoylformate decarboxylase